MANRDYVYILSLDSEIRLIDSISKSILTK